MKKETKNRDDDSLDTPVTKYDLLLEKMNSISTNLEEKMNSTSTKLEEKINSLSNSIKTIYWIMGINFATMFAGFTLLYNK